LWRYVFNSFLKLFIDLFRDTVIHFCTPMTFDGGIETKMRRFHGSAHLLVTLQHPPESQINDANKTLDEKKQKCTNAYR